MSDSLKDQVAQFQEAMKAPDPQAKPAETPQAPAAAPATPTQPQPTAEDLQAKYLDAVAQQKIRDYQHQQKIKELESRLAEREALPDDPYEYFQKKGGDLDELISRQLANGQPTTESQLEAMKKQVAELKQMQEDNMKRQREEAASQQRATYVNNVAADVFRELKSNTDNYQNAHDLLMLDCEASGADPQMYLANSFAGEIDKRFNETGQLLTPAELLSTIEQKATASIEKIRSSQTLRRIMGLEQAQETPPAAPQAEPLPNNLPPTLSQTAITSGTPQGEVDISRLPKGEWFNHIAEQIKK